MLGKLKTVALLSLVGAAVLVPLFGDPRPTPVTHAEWARMLLRALALDGVVERTASASQAFSTLSWRNSLAYRADHHMQGEGVEALGDGRIQTRGGSGEVTYPLAVVRGGDYRLRLRLAGNPKTPATVEITPFGKNAATGQFLVEPSSQLAWVAAGSLHLDPGAYTASVLLPPGTVLDHLELAPPCLRPIEPLGGWRATTVTQAADVAVTMLQALDLETDLPPAASPIEVSVGAFQTAGPLVLEAAARVKLSGGPQGLQAVAFVEIEQAGLYSVSVFGQSGAGQRWLADACQKAVLCPTGDPLAPPGWRVVMNTQFTSGRHFLSVSLSRGATVERLRLERKKDEPADYVGTLRRLGFDPGPEGPVARSRAVDAMGFLAAQKRDLQLSVCGDVEPPRDTVLAATGLAQSAAPVAGPAPFPGFSGGNPSGGPAGDPPTVPGTPPTPVPTTPPGSPTTLTARPPS